MSADESIGDFGNFIAAEDANDVIDFGDFFEQTAVLFESFGEASGDDNAAGFSLAFEVEHFVDDGAGFCAGAFDEAAGVNDDEVCAVGFGDECVAVLCERAEHFFAVDEVFGAAEADEGVGAFDSAGVSR